MNLYRRILRAEAMTGSHEANRPSIVIASVVVKPDGWETIQDYFLNFSPLYYGIKAEQPQSAILAV